VTRPLTLPDAPDRAPDDARMSAPAALRNRDAILSVVMQHAPVTGRALEIASGTGEHVIAFAPATPGLTWQPTDVDDARLASIAAWVAASGAANILAPRPLDACAPGWSAREDSFDLIVLTNLLHLISGAAADILLSEIAAALRVGGVALIYGPFLRDGLPTSPGDATFHASLQAQDPAIGYKDLAEVTARLTDAGLQLRASVGMPANNVMLCFARSA